VKRKRANTVVALSSAAVMAVYAAGFMRTRAAAEKLEHASRQRIPVLPAPSPEPVREAAAEPVVPAAPVNAIAAAPKPALKIRTKQAAEPVPAQPITASANVTGEPEKITEPAAAKPEPVAPAAAIPEAAVPPPPPPAPASPSAEVLLGGTELHDGTFLGWGTSRHGDIQASVTLLSGRITAVSIAQCRTRYSCDVIAHLPAKVLKDQTPEKINNVSGATQSVDAFYYAVVDAMNKAKAK
jgi:uncharacterized protein with FMN-binding domain